MVINDWRKDPSLKKMDPKKIEILADVSDRRTRTPGPQMLSLLRSLQAEAERKGIRFSDQETDVLVSILSAHMPPSEQKKLSVLRMFSRKMGSRRN